MVPLKQLCEILGVSWNGQLQRIKKDSLLKSVATVTVATAPDGKCYETLSLPLKFLNGFLFTISDKRLQDKKASEKLLLYKKECYDVLFNYFNQGFALNAEGASPPSGGARRGFLVPLGQLCNNLGLSWKGQHERIYEDTVLKATVRVTRTVAPDGKIRETLTLPLESLNGFLFTIPLREERPLSPSPDWWIIKPHPLPPPLTPFFGGKVAP